MSSKKEQLNIRISSELKTQLTRVSEERNLSLSDFIRTTLENAINNGEDLENRISSIEDKMNIDWDKHERRVLYAGATIANLDTGIPMDKCMATTLDVINDMNINFSKFLALPRVEMEQAYLGVQKTIKEKLDLLWKYLLLVSSVFLERE